MKKIFTLTFLSVFCLNAINAEIMWELSDDGTLTISGIGDMETSPWYSQRESIKNVIINNGVTSIGNNTFRDCANLKSIIIPNSVTSIGDWSFYGCYALTSIYIPNSVTSIGRNAFQVCLGLNSITIPNSVTSIGVAAFLGCSALTSIIVEKGNKTYDNRNDCNAIIETKSNTLIAGSKNTVIPNSVTRIGDAAFGGCSDLTSITIPNSVRSIGNSAFSGCSALTSITIPHSVIYIGSYAFRDCSALTSITIPNSVTSIGDRAFNNCSCLTSVIAEKGNKKFDSRNDCNAIIETESNTLIIGCNSTIIPNTVTSIGGEAFCGCSGLTSITIPNSVTSIGYRAFYGCSALTSIIIPNSVTNIEEYAFCSCSALTSIIISNSVTSIGHKAFADYSHLTSIIVEKGNKTYDSRNDCNAIIETESNTLIVGCNSTIIPNSVMNIGNSAFYGCSALTSITIPNSVMNIGNSAFYGCSALTSITIPNSVTNIREYAFYQCSNLTSVTIPNSVTNIGNDAFYGCSALTSITIPNSVTNIGRYVFSYCSSLTSIISESNTPPSCDDRCFYEVNKSISIHVPANSVALYKAANGWNEFTNIQAIIDNQAIANVVITKINAIGKVEYTDVCKGMIDEASTAYDALTDEQKALVSNLDVLTTAQQTYDNLKTAAEKLAADKAVADPVIAKINAIGKVEYTYACKDKIDEANNAYNALTEDQKALVSNLDVLTTAKQIYEELKAAAEKLAADKAVVDPVIAKINAIGKVEYTYACKDKIDEANNAYNALTADQKALVTNLDILTTAKQTYDALKAVADKLAVDKAAFDKYKSEVKVIIEALVRVDDSDAVKDIIRKAISDIYALEYDVELSLDDNKSKINSFVTSVNEAVEKQRTEEQNTNGINELLITNDELPVYDLNGKKIKNSMLKYGLYIRNGKKVIIK